MWHNRKLSRGVTLIKSQREEVSLQQRLRRVGSDCWKKRLEVPQQEIV